MTDADQLLRILLAAGKVPRTFRAGPHQALEVRAGDGWVQCKFGPDGKLIDLAAGDGWGSSVAVEGVPAGA